MDVIITLNSYLDRLSEVESTKPKDDRRSIPSISELARIAGIGRSGLTRISNNQIGNLNRKVLAKVISELRHRGFDTQVSDILVYVDEQ